MSDRTEGVKRLFYLTQILLGGGTVFLLFHFRSREPKSGFRVREADRWKPEGSKFPSANPLSGGPSDHSQATARATTQAKNKRPPLQLGGIRIDGTPSEILGIRPGASSSEIQKAYRDLIKRFHPDVVGRPGSREWADAQLIAEAINRAKDELLKAAKGRNSK